MWIVSTARTDLLTVDIARRINRPRTPRTTPSPNRVGRVDLTVRTNQVVHFF